MHTVFNIQFVSIFTISFGILVTLFTAFIVIKKWFVNKVETIVQQRVKDALKIKDLALRIKTGLESDSIIHEGPIKTFKYKSATILFADIQGFTKIVEKLEPELLIDELDSLFLHFDGIIEQYRVEKIKTIGDAYMAASGIPNTNNSHAVEMVLVALDFQHYMKRLQKERNRQNKNFWELRIGIDSGSVIAGRLGHKKSGFDVWGDTVNTASRMEASGLPNEINITESTRQLVKEFFECEYRGQMPVKYKGLIDMYFVKGILPELSTDGMGLLPNKKFHTNLQTIRLLHMKECVLNRLDKELNSKMHYHNSRHTMDVITQTEIIAQTEDVSDEELLLLKTAALMHDTGFLIEYKNHELNSTIIASEVLPSFGFTDEQIRQVNQLIKATHREHIPTNLLEMILKDADVDHLGRTDFFALSDHLYHEVSAFNGSISKIEWQKQQLKFLLKHTFYTQTGKQMREQNKRAHIQKLKEIIEDENKNSLN